MAASQPGLQETVAGSQGQLQVASKTCQDCPGELLAVSVTYRLPPVFHNVDNIHKCLSDQLTQASNPAQQHQQPLACALESCP